MSHIGGDNEDGVVVSIIILPMISPPSTQSHNTFTTNHILTPSHHHSLTIPPSRLVSASHLSQNKDYEKLLAEKAKSNLTDLELGIRTGKYTSPSPLGLTLVGL